jgi:hypothetical protein
VLDWLRDNADRIGLMALISVGAMIVLGVAGAIVIVHLPASFVKNAGAGRPAGGSTFWLIVRNALGWLLIAAGLAMLALPGPGLLVLLIGIILADFPGKKRLVAWILSRRGVLEGANRLRARFGKPPLKAEQAT